MTPEAKLIVVTAYVERIARFKDDVALSEYARLREYARLLIEAIDA